MSRSLSNALVLAGLSCVLASLSFAAFGANETAAATVNSTAQSVAGAVSGLPPLPPGKASLLGGTITVVDHLRDRLVLQIFGGGRTVVMFDSRTRVYRDGKAASPDDLKIGERVHLDTVLDGTQVFARKILVATETSNGRGDGQILNFEPASGELTLRDALSPTPWKVRLTPDTVILRNDRPATPAELRPGAVVAVTFQPNSAGQLLARQVSILASPGMEFAFSARIQSCDLHRGLLLLVDPRDSKSYEFSFDPADRALVQSMREGTDVTVSARFDGTRYVVQSVTLSPVAGR